MPNCYEIVERNRHALMGFALDAGIDEACGIITGRGTLWQVRNISGVGLQFQMDPTELVRCWPHAVAIWHTHPNGDLRPSERDSHGHPEYNVDGYKLGMVIATADDVGTVVPW